MSEENHRIWALG